MLAWTTLAEVGFAEVKNLAPISEQYEQLSFELRIEWSEAQLASEPGKAERYRYKRMLFHEYY